LEDIKCGVFGDCVGMEISTRNFGGTRMICVGKFAQRWKDEIFLR